MTNEEIIKQYAAPRNYVGLEQMLDLARADEREKMTQEKFAEYFNTLQGGEVASAILTQLLRRGVTDDDLRGLRLQWIKEKPEGVDVWVSWDSSPTGYATIQSEKPFERKIVGGTSYGIRGGHCTKLTDGFAKYLGIKQGECKKFRIVEVEG